MNWYEILKPEAERALRPLAEKVARLRRQLDGLRHQAENVRGDIKSEEEDLADFKGYAGARAAEGRDEYAKYMTALDRKIRRLDRDRTSLALFDREILPLQQKELDAARAALDRASSEFYAKSRPAVEGRMVDLMNQIVGEADAWSIAMIRLGRDLNLSFSMDMPRVAHARIATVEHYLSRGKQLVLTAQDPTEREKILVLLAPPPVASAPAPAPAHGPTPMEGQAHETPLEEPQDGPQAAQDAPGTTPTGTLDGPDGSEAPQDVLEASETCESGPQIDADAPTRHLGHTLLTGEVAGPGTATEEEAADADAADIDTELDGRINADLDAAEVETTRQTQEPSL
jgi:hypothetical protein